MFDDEVPEDGERPFHPKKNTVPGRKCWQGTEDADMLQEKQSGWQCRRDGSDGFDNAGGQDDN
jgi:hypothetical protein